jgi:hypothetical protein
MKQNNECGLKLNFCGLLRQDHMLHMENSRISLKIKSEGIHNDCCGWRDQVREDTQNGAEKERIKIWEESLW